MEGFFKEYIIYRNMKEYEGGYLKEFFIGYSLEHASTLEVYMEILGVESCLARLATMFACKMPRFECKVPG